jgi:hypothetical protein
MPTPERTENNGFQQGMYDIKTTEIGSKAVKRIFACKRPTLG